MKTLSERIQFALAQKKGGSQAELARACNVKPPSVWSWLHGGTKSIKGSTLLAAAEYLGVRARWLTDGLGPMREKKLSEIGHALEANEELPIYQIDWPFKTISKDEWNSIPVASRNLLEQQIKSLIPNATRQKIRA
jgi:transcriptional regulator with XRE-family HTH domain